MRGRPSRVTPAYWMLQRCGWPGSSGQAKTLSSPKRPTVTSVGVADDTWPGPCPPCGFQLPLPPSHSELSMVRSRSHRCRAGQAVHRVRVGRVPGGEAAHTPAGRDGQVVLVGERIGHVRRPTASSASLLKGFLPGVDPGTQFLGQQPRERVRDDLLRVQHTRLGHETAGADDPRLRRRGQYLTDIVRLTPRAACSSRSYRPARAR